MPLLKERVGKGLKVIMEPGRSIVCNAAILLARVQYTKQAGAKKYIIIDAAMNDLIRPTLYESYHFIWPTAPGVEKVPANRLKTLRVGGGGLRGWMWWGRFANRGIIWRRSGICLR